MDLLKELAPYQKDIDAHNRGFGISNKETLKALVDIWDKWQNIPHVSKKIYGSEKTLPPTDKGCSSCVGSAVKQLLNWKTHLETAGRSYQKLVPQKKTPLKPIKKEKVKATKKPEPLKIVDYSKLSWADLKKEAKAKGIKIHGKKKVDILKELND